MSEIQHNLDLEPKADSSAETPPRRVLIRASAGTGKTFRLSNWFLGELFSSADTAQILATTFTRKAAREILDRILVRLAEASLDTAKCEELAVFLNRPLTCDECQTLLDKLTRELHRLRVSTLDSFFAQIATNCSLDLGLPPGWTIIDGNSDRELRREAIDVLLREDGACLAGQLQHFTVGASNRSVTRLIDDAVNKAYQTYLESAEAAWKTFPVYQPLGADQLLVAIADLEELDLPKTAKGEPNKSWVAARDKALEAFSRERWEAFIQSGIASKILDRLTSDRTTIHKDPPLRSLDQDAVATLAGNLHEYVVRKLHVNRKSVRCVVTIVESGVPILIKRNSRFDHHRLNARRALAGSALIDNPLGNINVMCTPVRHFAAAVL